MTKAVFVDKDGTLVIDVPYNVNTAKIKLCDYAAESMALLSHYGYKLFIITNQPGIAKQYFTETELKRSFEALKVMLGEQNAAFDGVYYCPHNDDNTCSCRKPQPGLLQKAAADNNIDLTKSWMIGDILNDVEAGNNAGCKSILIDNGNETEWVTNDRRNPFGVVTNILDAAKLIITTDRRMI